MIGVDSIKPGHERTLDRCRLELLAACPALPIILLLLLLLLLDLLVLLVLLLLTLLFTRRSLLVL